MEGRNLSAAFITDPISIAYLTGFATNPHERLMALVIRDGRGVLVVPGLEEESASAASRGVAISAWRDGEDPWAVVGSALGSGFEQLAVEKSHLSLAAWERLQSVVRSVRPVDAGAEIRRLRLRKSADEI